MLHIFCFFGLFLFIIIYNLNTKIINLEEKYKEIEVINLTLSQNIKNIEYDIALKYLVTRCEVFWGKKDLLYLPYKNNKIDIENIFVYFDELSTKTYWINNHTSEELQKKTTIIDDIGFVSIWELYKLFKIFSIDQIIYDSFKQCKSRNGNNLVAAAASAMPITYESIDIINDYYKCDFYELYEHFKIRLTGYNYYGNDVSERFKYREGQYILRKVYDNYVNKIKEELGYD